ncbi:MAG: hypothetical protein V3T84_05230 [Phycisphaerales bacterium]
MPRLGIAILVLCLSTTVLGQSGDLKPLDQTVEDTSPLSRSLRHVERGLREPSAFDQVYRVPDRDDLLMRIEGGIYALFPQSIYMQGKNGTLPVIPAGTVFHIGYPDLERFGQVDASTGQVERRVGDDPYGRLNLRVDPRRGRQPGVRRIVLGTSTVPFTGLGRQRPERVPQTARQTIGPTIVTDAGYRADRIRDLMQSAARAVATRRGDSSLS